ncbi:DUF4426 domain-containing protein [Parahalioglobus pacificus]|uniref:DUF4426 domain-containing protein n=1 Tax=Parahalioglobus pacificus TaxID=930806 RepID=A0A918XJQ1_9GAMM|nr:DUF4426 domain-containing protein [Halioglobus pacificus]GHD35133.1 hypothetical protein GCM10007053_21690 [Halioglobus pacificus]
MRALLLITLSILCVTAQAQQSERFGPYELHYSVVNSTFVDPKVAAQYGITRGKQRAFLNLAVREHVGDITEPRAMKIEGRTWDLIQNQFLDFMEVREGEAIYYIGEFKFINEEWRFFEFDFAPEGSERSYSFKFQHQLYEN